MIKRSLEDAPKRARPGLLSHILLQAGDTATNNLSIAWVEVEPGSRQQPHHHEPEQAYLVISGQGRITVGPEKTEARAGDLLYIPPNVEHAVENEGTERLVYVSVTVPAVDIEALYDKGRLKQ